MTDNSTRSRGLEPVSRPDFDSDADSDLAFAPLINSGREIQVVELSKSGYDPRLWLRPPNSAPVRVHNEKDLLFSRSLSEWRKFLFAAFLPVDFPNSVSEDYLAYQAYDSLQAFFSTITSILSSRALLEGLGVGDANSSATLAMLLTILRDAISHVATIIFAHRFGLHIEPEAKRYRFLADLFNDTAFFLELWSPYLGFWGKGFALCIGEALRAMCGVAAGASKAALSLHFAKSDNLSELSAKEASQETAVSLIGLAIGTIVVRLVEDQRAVITLVVLLVLAHLWTNYHGVRSVHMDSFNKQRASILYSIYKESSVVPSPKQVALKERILTWDGIIRNARNEPVFRIDFAKSFGDAMSADGTGDEIVAVDGLMHTRFIRPYAPGQLGKIKILLWERAEAKHALLAWFMAMDTAWVANNDTPYGDAKSNDLDKPQAVDVDERAGNTDRPGPRAFDDLLWDNLPRCGWDLDMAVMEGGEGVRLDVRASKHKTE
ncbi:hypothetical protein HIM_03461 [Hirsutella minnesotensis 3608]|uniref:Protein root UVB sensitive/RUS domain-containing protein n=1 Tax=Hirsutella minnesotensis 3608 TaxID=1043627 RepID=A0A0F7ZQF1_9HYPO|nr:hypothetical protein HIM_03461 [Hirsutella minnesotensis 3608]